MLRCSCYLLVLSVLASCASQIPPTGGEKDIIPPQVIRSNPENLSVHFSEKKITLTFDEYIQLNDPLNQVFFSPALAESPEFRLKGKSLIIMLPDSLISNTTYTINFGSAIKDITESNIMLDYQYVFSTGSAIDSLRIQGRVINALDNQGKPNILVMLYREVTDSVVAKRKPDYNARTDSSGGFVLDHLRGGEYKLFALNDQNFNLLYDQPGETIAFRDSVVSVQDTSAFYALSFFKPEAERQSVLNAFSRQPGKASFAFAKRTRNLRILPFSDSLKVFPEFNLSEDTVQVWVNDLTSDSIAFILHDGDFSDTVKVRMKIAEGKQKAVSLPKLTINFVTSAKGNQIKRDEPLQLEFSTPVIQMDEKRKTILIDDSAKKEYVVKLQLRNDSVTNRQQAFSEFKFREGMSYTLVIPDSAMQDLFGNWNDSTKILFRVFLEEELGTLQMKFSFADSLSTSGYYYELLTKEGRVISKKIIQPRTQILSFPSLAPGIYSLRIIGDLNKNFRWDSGNYWQERQPEPIFFYIGAINLRANWDLELQMKVDNK